MEIEHEIMKTVLRLASGGRRRLHEQVNPGLPKIRGYGRILDLLSQNDGMSQQQIAQQLDIRPQSVSEAITSMESQALVEKQINAADKRSCLIYITPVGRQRQIDLQQARISNARKLLEPLTGQEKQTLLALLGKAAATLQENKEEC